MSHQVPESEKVGAQRLRLRQRRRSCSARPVREVGGRRAVRAMRKALPIAVVVLAAIVAGVVYVQRAQPTWYVQLRYPLHYDSTITGYGRIYHLDPALLAAVIYEESRFRPTTRVIGGRDRADAAAALDSPRNRDSHRRQALQDSRRPREPRPECALRQLVSQPPEAALPRKHRAGAWRPTTPVRPTSTSGLPERQTPLIQFAATRDYVPTSCDLQKLYRRAYAHRLGYRLRRSSGSRANITRSTRSPALHAVPAKQPFADESTLLSDTL